MWFYTVFSVVVYFICLLFFVIDSSYASISVFLIYLIIFYFSGSLVSLYTLFMIFFFNYSLFNSIPQMVVSESFNSPSLILM